MSDCESNDNQSTEVSIHNGDKESLNENSKNSTKSMSCWSRTVSTLSSLKRRFLGTHHGSVQEYDDYEYTMLNIHDDDKHSSTINSKKSWWENCCLCRIFSNGLSRASGVKRWICERWVFTTKINDTDTYPIKYTKCFIKVVCWTFGWIFCNRYCKRFYRCFTKSVRCIYSSVFSRPRDESIERQYKIQYDVQLKKVKTLTEECDILNVRLTDSETEINRLKTKVETKENQLKEVRSALEDEKGQKNSAIWRLKEERSQKEDALKRVEEEKREKEKALTRLSAVAGDKLRLNNPGIADLSDENRPNKLAEKFSELYDNEWTEVFEVLEEENFEEEKIIEMLLEVLKEIYNSCLEYARDQRDNLVEAIAKPSKSNLQLEVSTEGIMSKVIDLQKQTASFAFLDVKNTILQMKTLSQFTDHKVKQKYLDRCVQLCWMMAIQDPPMMLDFGPEQEEEVDKNTFRMYTKQGDRVDFIVWPAVFLHKDGPLVQKGVLQPK